MNTELPVEPPVIINPAAYCKNLQLRPLRLTPRRRAAPKDRGLVCMNCLTGSHHLCYCNVCLCNGKFREK